VYLKRRSRSIAWKFQVQSSLSKAVKESLEEGAVKEEAVKESLKGGGVQRKPLFSYQHFEV
jgi:hypothetical protein